MNIDYDALVQFLTVGYALNLRTFEEEKTYKPQNITPPELKTRSGVTFVDIKNELEDYFIKFQGKKVGVFLSGGKDSRIIAEMCHSLGLKPTAITFGHNRNTGEYIIAEKVCSCLGIPHMLLQLTPEIYTIENLKQSILCCQTDPTAAPHPFDYYYRDILSGFDVVFSGEYMTTSFREERFYQTKDNIGRVFHATIFDKILKMRGTIFDNIVKEEVRETVKQQLLLQNQNKTLNEMALECIINDRFKRLDITKKIFNLECPAIDENILNTMWSLPEKRTVKKIFSVCNYKTHRLSCTRSPFPLYFPWMVHYSYKYFRNFVVGIRGGSIANADMGCWGGAQKAHGDIIKSLAKKLSLPDSLDFDFLDKSIIKKKIENIQENTGYVRSIEKLIKLKIWLDAVAVPDQSFLT